MDSIYGAARLISVGFSRHDPVKKEHRAAIPVRG
jgi:hypothetical protein